MVNLIINKKQIKAKKGQTLLEVITEQKLDKIPTLCHHQELEPFTSCFLCLVEVKNLGRLKPACATKVEEGMIVETKSKAVKESRKTNLELLLSNHRADCYSPCRLGCPAQVDIQGYIALTSRGLYQEAVKLIKETNPLPLVCGRVCAHPCESLCRRHLIDQPVDIKNIKRFVADKSIVEDNSYLPPLKAETNKKVAIIGSGPAGLSAAYFLRLKGHQPTIFEKMPLAGGMLRYGIPEYRLPKADLQKEIDSILNLGIEIKFGQELGKNINLSSLRKKYEALFLGIGAWFPVATDLPGSDLQGVISGTDFLEKVNSGQEVDIFGNVFVVGGGNTAIDAARTALRLGAKEVTIIYRRTEAEMPAASEEIEDAKTEGVKLKILSNPVSYLGKNKRLKEIRIIKMRLGKVDSSGRRRPESVPESEFNLKADFVIEALGQRVDSSKISSLKLNKNGTIQVDPDLFLTSQIGVFAGGDAVSGPDLVIGAIAQGRKAAHVIDQYVRGKKLKAENRLGFYVQKEDFSPVDGAEYKNESKKERLSVSKENLAKRKVSFLEVEKGFTEKEVKKESERCLECGCQDLFECKLRQYAEKYQIDKKRFIFGDYKKSENLGQNKFFSFETNKCINCGQCVRVCQEIQKQDVLGFRDRGFKTKIVTANFKSLDETNCIFCGACLAVCPVGALTEKTPNKKPGPFKSTFTKSFCTFCGDACPIVVETRDNNFIKISSKINNQIYPDNLCQKGRFMDGVPEILVPEIDFLTKKIKDLDPQRTLISFPPDLLVPEIDSLVKFSEKQRIDLFSLELATDLDKIELLKKFKIKPQAEPDYSKYRNIYIFGDFTEDYNSVTFRKLIKNDQKQNIYLSFEPKGTYFRYQKFTSGTFNLNFDDTLLVFNLQKTEKKVLAQIFALIKEKKVKDYLILNNYVNYFYLLDKLSNLSKTAQKIKRKGYDNLVLLSEKTDQFYGDFRKVVVLKPLKSKLKNNFKEIVFTKGTIFDQFGQKKLVLRKNFKGV